MVRPGGEVVTSDITRISLYLGGVAAVRHDGTSKQMPAARLGPGDYIRAAHRGGFEIVDCVEATWGTGTPDPEPGQEWAVEAGWSAYRETPAAIIWHLRRR